MVEAIVIERTQNVFQSANTRLSLNARPHSLGTDVNSDTLHMKLKKWTQAGRLEISEGEVLSKKGGGEDDVWTELRYA